MTILGLVFSGTGCVYMAHWVGGISMTRAVLQCVAVCGSVLQCAAVTFR